MNKTIKISLLTSILATLSFGSEVKNVDNFKDIFSSAKIDGKFRTMYSGIYSDDTQNNYATASGLSLKYTTSKYKGFNGSVEFVTTRDIDILSGDDEERNVNLSSSKQNYTQLSNAYIDYKYNNLKLKIGRQNVDTPLADSDDIRMVANSFMGYVASYKESDFNFIGGVLTHWQGSDASLENGWVEIGDNGVVFGATAYEHNNIEASLWFYNISKGVDIASNSIYTDVATHLNLKNVELTLGAQYLMQKELDNSGVEAKIYGVTSEFSSEGLTLSLAYNASSKQNNKQSLSGFGGGTLYTNMDSMILDAITKDRDSSAFVVALSYALDNYEFSYAYGDFDGDKNSAGAKEHIVEQDITLSYAYDDNLNILATYTIDDDKEDSGSNDGDWTNARVLVSYNF